jgi:hypothetical protein
MVQAVRKKSLLESAGAVNACAGSLPGLLGRWDFSTSYEIFRKHREPIGVLWSPPSPYESVGDPSSLFPPSELVSPWTAESAD